METLTGIGTRSSGRMSKQYMNGNRKPKMTSKLLYLTFATVTLYVIITLWSPQPATPSPVSVSQPQAEINLEDSSQRRSELTDRLVNRSSPELVTKTRELQLSPKLATKSMQSSPELATKTPASLQPSPTVAAKMPESRSSPKEMMKMPNQDHQEDGIGVPEVAEVVERTTCDGRRVYTYPLPPSMNKELLDRCNGKLVKWINFCKHYRNHGFGAVVNTTAPVFRSDWYGTDAYMLEVIYYERMQQYPCATKDAREADLFFIPFFAGLDALNYLYREDHRAKPQGREVVAWLESHAEATWSRNGGRDHFYVAGRTAWDFSRRARDETAWGTTLYANPELENVSSLVLERRPWRDIEFAIPYPVGFHPSSSASLEAWIDVVESSPRSYLFSFSGALRPQMSVSIRGLLSQQCTSAGPNCTRLDCAMIKCSHEPEPIYTSLLNATFSLQPRGDTATRRSVIDSIVAGCIPVFFHEDTAQTQYPWHLPPDYENFSVFIPEAQIKDGTANVQTILAAISPTQVTRMRQRLIAIIPHVLYRHPKTMDTTMLDTMRDAFDVTIDGLAQRVSTFKAHSKS